MIDDLVEAGANIVGGLFGRGAADAKLREQQKLIQQSIDDLTAIGIPSVEAQKLALQEFRSAGKMTPELEESIQLGQSAASGISTDPKYKEASMSALDKLADVGNNGGLTASDRARLEGVQSTVNQQARGREGAIAQDMGARGQLGSGMELLARMQSSQDATTRLNDEGMNTAGRAEQRALDAMIQRGELGGKLQGQEFDQAKQVADAKDKIAAWNAANTQSVRQRNVGVRNDAQGYNLNNDQRISDSNTKLSNEQQQYNQELQQKRYQNELEVAKAKADARKPAATAAGTAAAQQGAMWGKLGQGVGQIAGGTTQQNKYATMPAQQQPAAEPAGEPQHTVRTMGPENPEDRWAGQDEEENKYASYA